MNKQGCIWYDNERGKYRVAVGTAQKEHIGRYASKKEAEAALEIALKGFRHGLQEGKA